jgi:sigma-B regulation protein RsbU (phosphoserine phosphatase)
MLARDIQLSLIPKNPPENPALAIVGQMVSSYEVGGDYFDYFPVDHRRVAVAIGDVSGKGVPAAMLMSSLRAVFKNLALKGKLGPAELNGELNEFLFENANTEQFATFFYGVIDTETNIFTFSNAGQCPALLVKDGYTDRLGEGGMVLGVRPSQSYQEGSVSIEPGDLVVLYTDGITEQTNREGDDYGEDRLIRFLELNKNLPVAELQEALLRDVVAFGGGNQDDDITSVIAYRKTA